MEITFIDFCLINFVSYILGLGTGLIICCKNKEKLLIKSRSHDNLSHQQMQQYNHHNIQNTNIPPYTSPIMASAPPPDKTPVTITLE
jgi:hypothetical protein